jgi:hypothetical protein
MPTNSNSQDYNSPTVARQLGEPFKERRFNQSERNFAARAAAQARTTLSAELLDYEATRFQSVRAILPTDRKFPYFCGQINAKNSFGAYTGWKDFYVDGGLFEIRSEGDGRDPFMDRLRNDLWRTRCSYGTSSVDTLDYTEQVKAPR